MASLEDLIAPDGPLTIGGQKYTLTRLRAKDYALVYQEITSTRADPVVVAKRLAEGLTPELQEKILAQAYDDAVRARHVSARELDEWRSSLPGFLFCFWLALRSKHPEITLKRATELAEQFGEETMADILAKSSGMPAGNSSSPTQTKTQTTPGPVTTGPSPGNSGSDA